jgi:hypothetical protein
MVPMNRILFAALCAVLLLSCRSDRATTLDRDEFVTTVVELRRAAMELRGDPGAYEVRREQLLQARGVTEDELRQYVEVHAGDVQHMAEVWNEINSELSERSMIVQ